MLKRQRVEEEDLTDDGRDLADISCELCRDRKLKCSRDKPLCTFCQSRDAPCRYTHIVRTALTRKNLNRAEARIKELEALLKAVREGTSNPSQDKQSQGSRSSSLRDSTPPLAQQRRASSVKQLPLDAGILQLRFPQTGTGHVFASEVLQNGDEARGDGTGSLLIDGGNGFLGSFSGAALLKFLQRCASDVQLLSSSRQGTNSPSPQNQSMSMSVGGNLFSSASRWTDVLHRLPNPERAPAYLDAYFRILHKQYPIIHEASFRAQLSDVIPRPGGQSWTMLHNAILGLGTLCVAEQPDQSDSFGYLACINTLLSPTIYDSPNITSVQAFTLLGNLAQKLNKPMAGSIYLGIALRMAISLGLHKEPDPNLSVFEQESRRRIWWVLYVFDSGAQITFGHPSTLPTHGVDVRLVINVMDDHLTPATPFWPQPCDAPTIYSSLLYQSLFHQLSNRITARITQTPTSAQEALALDSELLAWQSNLPPYFFTADPEWFDFARYRMMWRYLNLRMIILRPSFFRAAWPQGECSHEDELCWERCVASAVATIGSVQTFMKPNVTRSSTEWWYALHFLFSACFVPLIALRTRSTSNSSFEWLVAVQNALEVLQRVKHNSLAARCAEIIEAVVTRVPTSQTTSQMELPQNLLSIFGDDVGVTPETADSLASALTTPFDTLIAQWLTQEGSESVV